MAARRDQFVLVAAPGRAAESEAFLRGWLRDLDGHPGYLGGAVLRESAGEVFPDTYVLTLEFESTEAARALWPKIEGLHTPIEPDVPGVQPPDQGARLFEWLARRRNGPEGGAGDDPPGHGLAFNRGGGLFARLIHLHCEIVDEYRARRAGTS
ncbi:MAG TPA: hypothetical protein VNJ28_00795 [Candidatus Limnocylindrales bacterium]|jgi:hypothetical protein|nr:hypothetical protein [Candidatus Limnocylindrales bacterium]